MAANMAIPQSPFTTDAASVLYVDGKGKRWRLPKGGLESKSTERVCREVSTERSLLNIGGTFYELPADNAGGFIKLRPIATHDRRIHDFASYRGLLVMTGLSAVQKATASSAATTANPPCGSVRSTISGPLENRAAPAARGARPK